MNLRKFLKFVPCFSVVLSKFCATANEAASQAPKVADCTTVRIIIPRKTPREPIELPHVFIDGEFYIVVDGDSFVSGKSTSIRLLLGVPAPEDWSDEEFRSEMDMIENASLTELKERALLALARMSFQQHYRPYNRVCRVLDVSAIYKK